MCKIIENGQPVTRFEGRINSMEKMMRNMYRVILDIELDYRRQIAEKDAELKRQGVRISFLEDLIKKYEDD